MQAPKHCPLFRLHHRRLWRMAHIKKELTEAVNNTTPTLSPPRVPLPASTPRTMTAAGVRQEVSLEHIRITTPSWNRSRREKLHFPCWRELEAHPGRKGKSPKSQTTGVKMEVPEQQRQWLQGNSGKAGFTPRKPCRPNEMQNNQSKGITDNYRGAHSDF